MVSREKVIVASALRSRKFVFSSLHSVAGNEYAELRMQKFLLKNEQGKYNRYLHCCFSFATNSVAFASLVTIYAALTIASNEANASSLAAF